MKITAFNGSSRGKAGNTHIMVSEFLEGAKSAGAEVKNIILLTKRIRHCLACFECWYKTPGVCIQKDDTEELLNEITNSDVIVLATPLYVDNVSGIMKNFLDRMLPLFDPHFEKDLNGIYRHKKRLKKYPNIVIIANSGYPEQEHFQVIKLLARRMARNFHSKIIGEIYRGAGELLRIKNPLIKPIIDNYKKLLRQAGKEVVLYGEITPQTSEKLQKPLLPKEQYVQKANRYWDKMIKKYSKDN